MNFIVVYAGDSGINGNYRTLAAAQKKASLGLAKYQEVTIYADPYFGSKCPAVCSRRTGSRRWEYFPEYDPEEPVV